MPKQTTFIVSGYIERHYRLEIKASSYEEGERKGEALLDYSEPSDLYTYDDGRHIIIVDVEPEDSEWDEESEEEEEAI